MPARRCSGRQSIFRLAAADVWQLYFTARSQTPRHL